MSYQYHSKSFRIVESVNGKKGVVSIEPSDDSIEIDNSVEGRIRIRATGVAAMIGTGPHEQLPEEGPFELPLPELPLAPELSPEVCSTNDYKIYFDEDAVLRIENYTAHKSMTISNTFEEATDLDAVGLRFPQVFVTFCWDGNYLVIVAWKAAGWVKLTYQGKVLSSGNEEPPDNGDDDTFVDWHNDGVLIADSRKGIWVKFHYDGQITCLADL
jgi:hypothetical protein